MEILQKNENFVWITSEATLFWKCFGGAIAILFIGYAFSTDNLGEQAIGIFGFLLFVGLLTSIADTIFDIKNDKVYSIWRVLGFRIRDLATSISISELAGIRGKYELRLYLIQPGGRKYRICDLVGEGHYNEVIESVLKYVPIKHEKRF